MHNNGYLLCERIKKISTATYDNKFAEIYFLIDGNVFFYQHQKTKP